MDSPEQQQLVPTMDPQIDRTKQPNGKIKNSTKLENPVSSVNKSDSTRLENQEVTPTGFEPVLPAWKAGVLDH